MNHQTECESFLERLSRPRPDPGGGAAAAYGCLVSVALLEKICLLEIGRARGADNQWPNILNRVLELKATLASLVEEDCRSYLRMVQARTDGAGQEELRSAVEDVTATPLRILEACDDVLECAGEAVAGCSRHLVADLRVAAELAFSGLLGAYHIAWANLDLFPEPTEAARYGRLLREGRDQGFRRIDSLREAMDLRTAAEKAVVPIIDSGR